MGEISGEKKGIAELLEKIPPEKRWAITAKILTGFIVMRGSNIMAPILGKGEGIISPLWGWEKFDEINTKIFGEGGKKMLQMVKERFNIPVEDAIGAYTLYIVAVTIQQATEFITELIEAAPERVVFRRTKCAWYERYQDFGLDPELRVCPTGHQAWGEEGFKSINPHLKFTLTKTMPRGDPYCEVVIEFKEA